MGGRVDLNYDDSEKIKSRLDRGRLKIIDILSCGEQCACDIFEQPGFTQLTLSHHMKVLMDCGLVESRKDGLRSIIHWIIPTVINLFYFL